MYSITLLGCECSNSVHNNCFSIIFNISGNNHVVFDISNKLFREITVYMKKIKRINFMLLPYFCPNLWIYFLSWQNKFGLFRCIKKVIWTLSLQHLNMFIFEFWYVKFLFLGSYNCPAHSLAPLSFPLSLSLHLSSFAIFVGQHVHF